MDKMYGIEKYVYYFTSSCCFYVGQLIHAISIHSKQTSITSLSCQVVFTSGIL